jgi:hypothetical protein
MRVGGREARGSSARLMRVDQVELCEVGEEGARQGGDGVESDDPGTQEKGDGGTREEGGTVFRETTKEVRRGETGIQERKGGTLIVVI